MSNRCLKTASLLSAVATVVDCSRAEEGPRLRASRHERDARVEAFSPDGKFLVSSSQDGEHLRDAATGEIRANLGSPGGRSVTKIDFTPDGRLLFAQVMTGRSLPLVAHDVVAWDLTMGQPRGSFLYVAEHLDLGSFSLSADGRYLAFIDNSAKLPAQVKSMKFKLTSAVEYESEMFRNMHPGLTRVKIWDVPAWKEVARVDGGLPLTFSPDGKTLATGGQDWKEPIAKLWNAEDGRLRIVLRDRSPGLWPMTFSPDGKLLASGGGGDKSLWSVGDGRR